jgi:hypothetical protein
MCLHCKTYICDKRKNIHTTVYTTIQHEIIYIKTPLQDLQLKAFMKNNPYSTEMNTNIHLITFSILLFTNFQTNKQRSSGLYQHYIFLLTNIDFIALNISVNNLLGIQLLPSILCC